MNIDYKIVGARIAKRRKALGLKQYQVCEMIDVNYKYLSNLETGRSSPSLELIMSLCEALQTSPDYFLVGTERDRINDKDVEAKIGNLTENNKRLINGIIDLMIENQD